MMNSTSRLPLLALSALSISLTVSLPLSAQTLGDAGESCKKKEDCKAGLKCENQTCVSEDKKQGEDGKDGDKDRSKDGDDGDRERRSDDKDGDGERRRSGDDGDGGERRRRSRDNDDGGRSGGGSDLWGKELDSNRGHIGG